MTPELLGALIGRTIDRPSVTLVVTGAALVIVSFSGLTVTGFWVVF